MTILFLKTIFVCLPLLKWLPFCLEVHIFSPTLVKAVDLSEVSWNSTQNMDKKRPGTRRCGKIMLSIKHKCNKVRIGQIDQCGETILSEKGERNFRKFLAIQYCLCRNSLEVKVRPGWDFGKLKETPRSFKVFTTAPKFYQSYSRVIILPLCLVPGKLRQIILSSILGRMFLKFHLFQPSLLSPLSSM